MRIEVKDICFSYNKKTPLLHNVNLSIEPGEKVALVGPSGCGKSTLSQIMAGNIKPSSGEVLLDGKPLPHKGFCPIQMIYQHPEKAINPRWKMYRTLIYNHFLFQRILLLYDLKIPTIPKTAVSTHFFLHLEGVASTDGILVGLIELRSAYRAQGQFYGIYQFSCHLSIQ